MDGKSVGQVFQNLGTSKHGFARVVEGLTTFLAMAYIAAVNPAILSAAGMPFQAALTSTCLGAALVTIGIGIFVAFIGLKGRGIIADDASTLLALGNLASPACIVSIISILLAVVLHALRVPDSLLISIKPLMWVASAAFLLMFAIG